MEENAAAINAMENKLANNIDTQNKQASIAMKDAANSARNKEK